MTPEIALDAIAGLLRLPDGRATDEWSDEMRWRSEGGTLLVKAIPKLDRVWIRLPNRAHEDYVAPADAVGIVDGTACDHWLTPLFAEQCAAFKR